VSETPLHQLSLKGTLDRQPRVTVVVNSGPALKEAGIQIKVDGKILSAHILPFANKKKPLRFCVGHPDARSSYWTAFANKATSDVYIGIRSSADLHKISLHQSGDFRYQLIGMTQDTLDRPDLAFYSSDEGDGGRILHQWRRPEPGPHGWIECLSIVVPAEDLQRGPASPRDLKDIVWIPAPPTGKAVEVRGFLVRPRRGEFSLDRAVREGYMFSLLGGFKLADGQVFVLLSATSDLHPEEASMMDQWREKSRRLVHDGFDWSPENHPRMLAFAAGPDGYPTFFDARA
jgi:hypothetical protein